MSAGAAQPPADEQLLGGPLHAGCPAGPAKPGFEAGEARGGGKGGVFCFSARGSQGEVARDSSSRSLPSRIMLPLARRIKVSAQGHAPGALRPKIVAQSGQPRGPDAGCGPERSGWKRSKGLEHTDSRQAPMTSFVEPGTDAYEDRSSFSQSPDRVCRSSVIRMDLFQPFALVSLLNRLEDVTVAGMWRVSKALG